MDSQILKGDIILWVFKEENSMVKFLKEAAQVKPSKKQLDMV